MTTTTHEAHHFALFDYLRHLLMQALARLSPPAVPAGDEDIDWENGEPETPVAEREAA